MVVGWGEGGGKKNVITGWTMYLVTVLPEAFKIPKHR